MEQALCDRCNKKIEIEGAGVVFSMSTYFPSVFISGSIAHLNGHLCRDCFAKFEDAIGRKAQITS